MNNYTLGSLFDGSGGFPLAGCLCGIEPKWAAEVEPYPIAVTRSRFPKMRHLGDISKVNGADIDPVDIITFGSPCQDLSVAGKRAGLKHADNGDEETTRSGLFMEAVRIIKEMRRATNGKYPSFALWENVPGAFSSNKGEDFRIVLEELIKVVEPSAFMPGVPPFGWAYADSFVGDGWSLAWRVFDAQYWGVPQRRRRIHLVLDLRGERAREVLFEREGVRGYFAPSRTTWQAAAADAQDRTGADDRAGESAGDGRLDAVGVDLYNQAETGDKAMSIRCRGDNEHTPCTIYAIDKESWTSGQGWDRKPGITEGGPCPTLQTSGTVHAVAIPVVTYDARGNGDGKTVNTITGDHENRITDYTSVICLQGNGIDRSDNAGCNGKGWNDEACYTLNTIDRPAVAYSFDSLASNSMKSSNPHSGCREVEVAKTLDTTDPSPNKNQGGIAVVCVEQGGGKSACNVTEENSPTLTCTHEGAPAVAYGVETFHCNTVEDKVPTLKARDWKDPNVVAYGLDRASFNQGKNALYDFSILEQQQQPTLTARGPGAVCHEQVPQYIVRRLTPTECARLQGFADRWGDIDKKDSFTPEEFNFWLEVRNTHAAINGKQVKDYTEKQMLTWYHKLQTDSAEYKMWGNGVALPPALYCMQGIVDALNKEDTDDWMN